MATNDLRTALAEDDGSLPQRWNAEDEPGTTLWGTFLRYETIVTSQGEGKIAVIQDDDDGTVWGVALFRTVLRKRFETLDPRAGDTVGVKFIGWVEPATKDGRGYFNYAMRMERGSTPAPVTQEQESDDELPF